MFLRVNLRWDWFGTNSPQEPSICESYVAYERDLSEGVETSVLF